MTESGIFLIQNYGTVVVTLKEIMDKQHITRNKLARLINTRYEVIDKWYGGSLEKVDLDVLARICFVLKCSVADILHYQ